MQIQLNVKNCLALSIVLFFLYLIYLLYFGDSSNAAFPSHFSVDLKDIISYCILAAEIGGSAIVKIQGENSLWKKSKSKNELGGDDLMTKADVVSQQLIIDALNRAPGLKIISEEKVHFDNDLVEKYKENNFILWTKNRKLFENLPSQHYLLSDVAVWVDPLDATQEFTEGLLEYVTVMICVTIRGKAKFGVIHRPFSNQTTWGLVGHGVFPKKIDQKNLIDDLKSSNKKKTIVISRSHAGKVEKLIEKSGLSGVIVEKAGGSGYKALRVLNGSADLYVHVTKIKRWDTCAPDALIRAAGGRVTDLDGSDLVYKPADFKDPVLKRGFVASLADHFYYVSKFSSLLSDITS